MGHVSDWYDGMKPFVIGAAVLVFFGVLAILLEVQSPTFVQWNGIKVHGVTYRGLTSYTYDDVPYTIDRPDISAGDTRHIPTTVWLARDDPTNTERAYIESPWDRWTDFVFVTGWFVAAFVLVAIGWIRMVRRRRRHEVLLGQERFGTGLDPAVVQRLLTERRRPPPVTETRPVD